MKWWGEEIQAGFKCDEGFWVKLDWRRNQQKKHKKKLEDPYIGQYQV